MIVMDIETIPDPGLFPNSPGWFKESKYFPRPKMSNLKDPVKIKTKQKEWEEKGGIIKDLSIKPWMCQPICFVAMGNNFVQRWHWEMKLRLKSCLELFVDIFHKNLPIITFKGKSFDFPVLSIWAAKIGWGDLSQGLRKLITSPYENGRHCDIYTLFPNTPNLETVARILGIKEIEKYGSGGDVWEWYLAGKSDKIIKHCESDVKLTWECAKKLGIK